MGTASQTEIIASSGEQLMTADVHPLQEPLDELISDAFPWECPRRREAVGDENNASLTYFLDPYVSIVFCIGENHADVVLLVDGAGELETNLPVEEWADFQGWVGVVAARYAELRSQEPLELIVASNMSLQLEGSRTANFRPGDCVTLRPHTNEVRTSFDGFQFVIAPDIAKILHDGVFLLTPEEWARSPLSKRPRVTLEGIIETKFQHGNPRKRSSVLGQSTGKP